MKLVTLTVFCWLRIPVIHSIDMLDCALGRVAQHLCPQDGGWSQWSAWGPCEGECGGVGRQLQTRTCSNAPPQHNGAYCDGDHLEMKPCSVPGCSYEQYEKLVAEDPVRQQALATVKQLSSSQHALLVKCLASNCDRSDIAQVLPGLENMFWNSLICIKRNTGCPAAGGWGNWSPWTRCNARCGSGQQMRCRACCDPPPSSSGAMCRGEACEYQPCTGKECSRPLSEVGDWSPWSDWSACSSPCNFGYKRRTRICQKKSEMSSNKESSDLIGQNDDGIYDDADHNEEYISGYDGDREDDDDEMKGDENNSYDNSHSLYSLHKRSKRGEKKCDSRVEYYYNDDEEVLVTTLKPKRKDQEIETNKIGRTEAGGKIAVTPKIQTPMSSTIKQVLGIITQSNALEESSNEYKVEESTNFLESADILLSQNPSNLNIKVKNTSEKPSHTSNSKKISLQTKKKGNQKVETILPDYQDAQCDDCGELYKNSPTSAPCKKGGISIKSDDTRPKSAKPVKSGITDFSRTVTLSEESYVDLETTSTPSGNLGEIPMSTEIMIPADETSLYSLTVLKTTLPQLERIDELEISHVEDLNISRSVQPINCDLSKNLQLPSFKDSFPAEGCNGPFEELQHCNTQPCNEEGGWSDWSSWSPCLPECGLGGQSSVRSCSNPEPRSNTSQQCVGDTTRHRSCYSQPCPVSLKTSKAVFMTGESVVRYEATQQHSNVLLLYVRLRHFSPSGNIVSRRLHDCSHKKICDHVTLSLYNGHILVSVLQKSCYIEFLTSQRLSAGDWHDILLTVVGAVVTLRLDDGVLTQTFNLSCRPSSPNYDADTKVGGSGFVGEVDQLIINFKNYAFQKKHEKRDAQTNDNTIAPSDSSQVQYEINSKDVPTASLSQFLQAPCFTNQSSWNIDLAIKPYFPDGLVLFIRGYDSRDFLFVSLEQSRIRLRMRVAAQAGECEQPQPVVPLTWVHLGLTRMTGGVGLSVNGGPHCVVSLAPPDIEEPEIYCTGGILLGQMPLRVKTVLSAETSHAEPVHSPLGLLGHLAVNNHTLDLSHLPRKIAPDLTTAHPDQQFRLSSHTASSTVYYEEMLILHGERLSMPCIYDLSPENKSDSKSTRDLDNNWYKLDTPVSTVFSNVSGVHYEIQITGKDISLNITSFRSPETVEGFYSCWMHYPLPLQSGLNIVTYGVVVVSTTHDKRSWKLMIAQRCLVVVLLVLLVLWLLYELFQDYKQRCGFYRCKKLNGSEAHEAIRHYMLSEKAIFRLGGQENAEKAFERYIEFLEQQAQAEALREVAVDTDVTTDTEVTHSPSEKEDWKGKKKVNRDLYHSLPERNIHIPKNMGQKVIVGRASMELESPFAESKSYSNAEDETRKTIELLLQSDTEEAGENVKVLDSREANARGIGQIQNTFAYRSIENELKFKPEKFKNLGKYVYTKKNIKET